MDLRRTTLWLILGSVYIVVHKALHALIAGLGHSAAGTVMQALWFGSTLTLILFAYQFLREARPRDLTLRCCLVAIMVLTGMVMMAHLPFLSLSRAPVGHRVLFGGASMLNAIALFVFVVRLERLMAAGSPLRAPLRLLTWALGATVALALVGAAYMSVYMTTGTEVAPPRHLQPVAVLSFVFTHGMTMWFLVRFWRLESYEGLVAE